MTVANRKDSHTNAHSQILQAITGTDQVLRITPSTPFHGQSPNNHPEREHMQTQHILGETRGCVKFEKLHSLRADNMERINPPSEDLSVREPLLF